MLGYTNCYFSKLFTKTDMILQFLIKSHWNALFSIYAVHSSNSQSTYDMELSAYKGN